MKFFELKTYRKKNGLSQQEAALRLEVSQSYLSLLEKGKRPLSNELRRKVVRVFQLSPVALPPSESLVLPNHGNDDYLARELAMLGYPGFAYMWAGKKRNPAEVLLKALARPELDTRVTEALPWLVFCYPDMDRTWLLAQARVANLSNRLGFVVELALDLAKRAASSSSTVQALSDLVTDLKASRLDVEQTLCQDSLSENERAWLRENRSAEAKYWHLLTNWRLEHLQYAAS